jgi:hypothetical protein
MMVSALLGKRSSMIAYAFVDRCKERYKFITHNSELYPAPCHNNGSSVQRKEKRRLPTFNPDLGGLAPQGAARRYRSMFM